MEVSELWLWMMNIKKTIRDTVQYFGGRDYIMYLNVNNAKSVS